MSIIELENVNFQYRGSKDGSLVNVNLNIEEGQTVEGCMTWILAQTTRESLKDGEP